MILGFFSTGNQGSPLESMTVNEESVTVWFLDGSVKELIIYSYFFLIGYRILVRNLSG